MKFTKKSEYGRLSEIFPSKNKGKPMSTLKVDIMKGFDIINWTFVLTVMQATCLPPTFVAWISDCLTFPTFSININGGLKGFFTGKKGLMQGDPLSPYLFKLLHEGAYTVV